MLARRLGLPTANSRIMRFDGELAIVVERYDRRRTEAGLVRIHQEDICQALAVRPVRKYENEGGPGVRDILALLRTHSSDSDEDVSTFIDALIFNWLIAGTDAHAKNFSLLIAGGGVVRLAPLYDLASILPYDDFQIPKIKLAMKIGPDYRLRDIGQREWRRLAEKNRLDPDRLIERIRDLAVHVPAESSHVRERLRSEGLQHDVIDRLTDRLAKRASDCREIMEYRP
jgi:serine/threonine-protein kinase HipA